ncbi:MAG: hypothetical protein FWG12_04445 [Holophagaceae bacterium]|nr:hypothetical protein [Holophagaceae bacterium]
MSFIILTEAVSKGRICVNPAYIVMTEKHEDVTRISLHNGISIEVTEPFDGLLLLLKAESLVGGNSISDIMAGEMLDHDGHLHNVTKYTEFGR